MADDARSHAVEVRDAAGSSRRLADLTRFYFHANHLGGDGRDVFTPRFTLTSLMLPSDEPGPAALEQLSASRTDPRIVELLVPANDRGEQTVETEPLTLLRGECGALVHIPIHQDRSSTRCHRDSP